MSGGVKEELLEAYLNALRERGGAATIVDALGDAQQTVVFIDDLGYVVIAISVDFPGCWQLEQARIDAVCRQAAAEERTVWYALLLQRRDGRGANGYILSDLESSPVKRAIEAEDGQLLIREKRHLDSLRLILSTEKQAELLLRKRS
jgi:hypothetical protein